MYIRLVAINFISKKVKEKKRVKSRFKPKWLTAQINDYRKNGTWATNEKILPIT